MVAGALAIILALVLNAQRARTQHTVVTERRGAPDVVERRVDGDEVVERRVEHRDETPLNRGARARPVESTGSRGLSWGGGQHVTASAV